MHNVVVHDNMNNIIKMENFSSTKFNMLFMDKPILPNMTLASLEQTTTTEKLEEAIQDSIAMINDNRGFEVLLWYLRGEINDCSLMGLNAQEDESRVDSGKISYHIVDIKPLNKTFFKPNQALGMALNCNKFKVGENL